MKSLTLLLATLAAAATFSAPAGAAPCNDLTTTIPECVRPLRDRLQALCFPPDPADPYGC